MGHNGIGELGIGSTVHIGDDPSETGDAIVSVNLGADFAINWIGAQKYSTCGMFCSLQCHLVFERVLIMRLFTAMSTDKDLKC